MAEPIYIKYSNDRARQFALRTEILNDNGVRQVVKTAAYPEGQEHITNLARWYRELSARYASSRIQVNECNMEQETATFVYLEGTTLEDELDAALAAGRRDQLEELLFSYLEEVKKGFTIEQFEMTEDFRRVLGDVTLPQTLLAGDPVDMDMVCGNIIVGESWTLIDYEWTFAFPIPYHFVVYRIMDYYFNGSSSRGSIPAREMMEKAGLTPEEIAAYAQMERHFQEVYLLKQEQADSPYMSLRLLYDQMTPGSVALSDLGIDGQDRRASRMVQLYQAADLCFSEEKSEKRAPTTDHSFQGSFKVDADSRCIRLDPASCCCEVQKLEIRWGGTLAPAKTNGIPLSDDRILFPGDDPQIIVERAEACGEPVEVSFAVTYPAPEEALTLIGRELTDAQQRLQEADAKDQEKQEQIRQTQNQMKQMQNQLKQMQSQLKKMQNRIREMENTRVWKAYKKIKRT